jgi:glycosyltransferase involved in cell wall biosynthesis
MGILYVVVPCYNEEACLPESAKELKGKLNDLIAKGSVSSESKIVFVDDGSKDKTWDLISSLHGGDSIFQGVRLSRNEGHQYACMAGLSYAVEKADAAITIDADLQDDINAVDAMIEDFNQGVDVVYGIRTSRQSDTFFKRTTAVGYYKFLRHMGVEIIDNHADFRLMDRRALKALLSFNEGNLFLRGIVPLVGFKSATVGYSRKERRAGESHYPLQKMLALAWNGITSFSVKPLTFIPKVGGFLMAASSMVMVVFGILFGIGTLPYRDLPFILGSVFLAAGLILVMMGILGEYIGKINIEVKHRPHYFIEEILQ